MEEVILSDKSYFTRVHTSEWVHVWMPPAQSYDRDRPRLTVKHRDISAMTWTTESCFSAEPIVTLKGRSL
ncbi:hypothetical protein TNCV_1071541 [Trichonephila clavipes]|nr:hypothetical protein TNCV_1071541 [Trichonephila clavipes]